MTQEKLYEELLSMVHEGMKEIHKTGLEGIREAEDLETRLVRCGDYARGMTGMGTMLSTLALIKPLPMAAPLLSQWAMSGSEKDEKKC